MKDKLTNDNIQTLQKLIYISTDINKYFNKLSHIAYLKGINNLEYQSTINLIKRKMKEEDKIYNSLDNNFRVLSLMVDYLIKQERCEFTEAIDAVRDLNSKELIIYRIVSRIDDIINKLDFDDDEMLDIEDIIIPEDFYLDLDEDPEEAYLEDVIIDEQIKENIVSTIVMFLNEYIDDDKYLSIREYLVKFKYDLAYAFNFIFNNLNDNYNNLVWNGNDLDNDNFHSYEDFLAGELLINQEELFLNYSMDTQDIRMYARVILTQIIIRTAFIFCKDQTINSFKALVFLDLLECEINSSEVLDVINGAVTNVTHDRKLGRYLK